MLAPIQPSQLFLLLLMSIFSFRKKSEYLLMPLLDQSEHHVLYRVTPFFKGDELVARGVEMEAWSVEDHGQGVCFHVFVYNQQPGVVIDYSTGDSRVE